MAWPRPIPPGVNRLTIQPPPDIAEIQAQLEWAGGVLLALNLAPVGPDEPRGNWPDFPSDPGEAYGYTDATYHPAAPPSMDISKMDAILAWVEHIPHPHIRRVVNARALVSPTNQRYVFPWARLAKMLGTNRQTVKRWHAQGLGWIMRQGKAPRERNPP